MRLETDVQFKNFASVSSVAAKHEKVANAVVEKATVINEMLQKGLEPKKLGDALSGLNFSEASCVMGEKIGYQFADDVATPAIGNWTFGSLNMIVQEVGSSLEKDTLLSLALPDKLVPMYKILLDRIAGNTGMLAEFAGDSTPLAISRPLDTYGLTYQPGLWANRCLLTAKDMTYARERGVTTFADRGAGQLVAYNAVNLVTQAFTRKNYLLNQAIFNNGFTYAGTTISSNIPGGNFLALDSMGVLNANGSVTYSNTDPLYSPLIAITNVVNNPALIKYHSYIRGIIMNDADLMAILNHPNVKPVTNALMMGGVRENKSMKIMMGDVEKEINTYYAPGFQIPFLSDRETWQEQNLDGTGATTNNFFVPRGKMFILMDLTAFGGQLGAFHLTYNEVDPNTQAPAMGLFTGVFNRNLENSNTTNRLDIVAALSGAPAVYMPEACFVLTSLYSNV